MGMAHRRRRPHGHRHATWRGDRGVPPRSTALHRDDRRCGRSCRTAAVLCRPLANTGFPLDRRRKGDLMNDRILHARRVPWAAVIVFVAVSFALAWLVAL